MIIKLTGTHSLKSPVRYDSSRNIAETTHIQFRFAEYDIADEPLVWTGRYWEGVFSIEELFDLLLPDMEERYEERHVLRHAG